MDEWKSQVQKDGKAIQKNMYYFRIFQSDFNSLRKLKFATYLKNSFQVSFYNIFPLTSFRFDANFINLF